MIKDTLKERYQEVLEILSKDENYIAIQMCRLGYPQEEKGIPTACVAWDDNKKKVKFLFNKKFAHTLNDEEFAFVTAHESIHLLNGHVSLLKTKFNEMEKAGKSQEDMVKFQKKFNIAADCVVNDSLVNLYGFKRVMEVETKEKPQIIYGINVVKRECHDLTVMEVFYLLTDEIMKQFENNDVIHDWSSFFDEDGNLIEEFADQIKGFYAQNGENSALSDEDLEKIEKLKKHFEKNNQMKAGTGKVGAYRAVDNMSKVSINWNKLTHELVEVKKQENIWTKPNKKLISVYPDILLPSMAPEERESIFIAIDASGSIDYNALKLFVSVVKSISNKFIIKAISFDDECYDYDIKSNQNPRGGGGTNFQIIEDWIQTNLKKYPKSVFVLTDGEGTYVKPKFPERWCWVLYGSSTDRYCKTMKNFKMKDLLK
jgi:predicted metal-dependent peptidase